jgi:hypothetical protein
VGESPDTFVPMEQPTLLKRFWNFLINLYSPANIKQHGIIWGIGLFIVTIAILLFLVSFYWGQEPDTFDVVAAAEIKAKAEDQSLVTGYVLTNTLIEVVERGLLDKPGGYLSNDKLPPSTYMFGSYPLMDNIPNWEFGVLLQVRDFSKILRTHISRSQSLGREHADLTEADPEFNIHNNSWLMPPAETAYRKGIKGVETYLGKLTKTSDNSAQFFARADNFVEWLKVAEQRLGDLSQRLSDSVGQERFNTDLAGDAGAKQSTPSEKQVKDRTPWLEIDDVFYTARGTCWALLHLLQAAEVDFKDVLDKKKASVSLQQIIRELESTQKSVWSPMVLNGSEFGFFSNHSLVLSSYITRAQTGIARLIFLLREG